MNQIDYSSAIASLVAGEVGIIPTDTLYGIVGSALKPPTVGLIYRLRERDLDKPLIVMLSSAAEIGRFVAVSDGQRELLEQLWPGPVSVILRCQNEALAYLHRNSGGVAFRVPANPALREFLKATGPLVAPSANPQGSEPATSVEEAQNYFGDRVAFYIDGGRLVGEASALIDLRTDTPHILRARQGIEV